jgi:hypothetical protein
MSAVVFAIALAALSDCGVERVATDPAWLSGKRCFNWTDLEGDATDEHLREIRETYERFGRNNVRSLDVTIPVCNWDSARLSTIVVNVILREIMGYETELDFIGSTSMLYECVADGTHTFNTETWINTKETQRQEWVHDQVCGACQSGT